MIKKIKKIKNLGIFSNYQWDSGVLADFERYNIFYGWNGTGKTTLTKLFAAIESGSLSEFPNLEYEISSETATFKNGEKFDKKIRVFNQDYIENNIEIAGSKTKPIFILGEENKDIAEQIEKDETLLKELNNSKNEQEKLKEKKETEKGNKFTDVAKVIGANTSGSSLRNYRKPDAEKAFAALIKPELLGDEDINGCLLALKQEEKVSIPEIDTFSFLQALNPIIQESKNLCAQTVEILVIERLKQNIDISRWVEDGLALHLKHGNGSCEFCGQFMPESRMQELVNYFNKEDQELKASLNRSIEQIKGFFRFIEEIVPVDKANLYTEFQTEYVSRLTTFNKERINLLGELGDLIRILEDKKTKTTERIDLEFTISNKLEKSIEEINKTIQGHNGKTANFQNQRDEAQKKLENHYLSEIFQTVKDLEKGIENCDTKIKKIIDGDEQVLGIIELSQKIEKNKATISSEHKACEELNRKLEIFLGRKEITFEVSPHGGYEIKRSGKIAKNLSEGEKTAIAFVYFTVHLNDQGFNVKDGIIVIDDPVSSMDANSLFQAFAFLKNSVENAKQVFIFTHNFDFLRLLINWLNYFYQKQSKPYFMIGNKVLNNERIAEIKKIDPLLIDHESEYHYLCKILLELEIDGSIVSVYHIPNVARKVLETFLMFRVPNSEKTFSKLKRLNFDEIKKTAIYKFTNDQSHITGGGFDPSLVPETQKNVKYLLEMMDATFPEHFDILKQSITES
ncbi:MAG: hypothetical protein UX49_C0016G0023 [Candidatus Wolfebacteria bacterium GW2011_GWC2_46_275]|nr:MAG: hypothetical protein UX49_C0016G0023 [Candidatus Wolfebacteria bacterium GW2011_GWC2_46_275]KKU41743.1 MAG: hypothetical protein UX58_C0006G0052 [Candidatus Wolfebacteria bacterium GW2011_GWB2_46_69]KKU53963.1 MAG: hypothetical protein UX76_C0007G0022 [Candidatus Wolfebacteria bacterium GW2011_GWC1_47_103]KKU72095.1 MAG: hypothetical protein UX96_C0017G0023 [Candidatus Wolfebacteria bacterium GW2011_GWB1_47_243]